MLKTHAVSGISRRFCVTVQDNGCGISADHLKNVFDPFFSTKEEGTGLGLPLSLGIVENHGGQLRIASHEGIGTSVSIEWPEQVAVTATSQETTDEDDTGS
jgi:signal transduction histidine kinase